MYKTVKNILDQNEKLEDTRKTLSTFLSVPVDVVSTLWLCILCFTWKILEFKVCL